MLGIFAKNPPFFYNKEPKELKRSGERLLEQNSPVSYNEIFSVCQNNIYQFVRTKFYSLLELNSPVC
jgi:hypothetical protein